MYFQFIEEQALKFPPVAQMACQTRECI